MLSVSVAPLMTLICFAMPSTRIDEPTTKSSRSQLRPSLRVMVSKVPDASTPCTTFIDIVTLVARMLLGASTPMSAVRNSVLPLTELIR